MNQRIKIAALMALGILAMSSASTMIRFAQAERVPSLVIAAYRLTLATAVLTLPAIRDQAWKEYAKLTFSTFWMLVSSGFFLGLHFATWITSLSQTSIINSVVLVSSTPVWIGLASPVFLKERPTRLMWAGVAISMIGAAVIGLGDLGALKSGTGFGDVLALLGAIFAAAYLVIGRRARSKVSLTAYVWIVYGSAATFLLALAAVTGVSIFGYTIEAYGWLIALALIPQLVGHTVANYAVRLLPATLVGISILGEPIGATILGVVLLQEMPSIQQATGGGLVLIGIGLASFANESGQENV